VASGGSLNGTSERPSEPGAPQVLGRRAALALATAEDDPEASPARLTRSAHDHGSDGPSRPATDGIAVRLHPVDPGCASSPRRELEPVVSDRVRWGVLGCASIALDKVIPAMQQSERCTVTAIASRDAPRAAAVASALDIPRHYGAYEDLLADEDVEAVYIPLPNHLHAAWTLRAAAAGKHVLCEKPLAMTSAEAQRMVEGCRSAGVALMEAFMYRLHPLWRRICELVGGGAIGDLEAIQAFFSYRNLDPQDIRNVAEFGGGALMDIGCYPINVARMMFGSEPTRVTAAVRCDPRFGTDVLTSAVLDFGGRHATFTCSTQLEDDQRVRLVGTEGRLLVELPFNIPPDRPTRILRFAGGRPPVEPGIEVIEVPPADPYSAECDAFSAAIRDRAPVPIPPADAVATMVVIEQILAAAKHGRMA
jgi:predicted dehydrogenase